MQYVVLPISKHCLAIAISLFIHQPPYITKFPYNQPILFTISEQTQWIWSFQHPWCWGGMDGFGHWTFIWWYHHHHHHNNHHTHHATATTRPTPTSNTLSTLTIYIPKKTTLILPCPSSTSQPLTQLYHMQHHPEWWKCPSTQSITTSHTQTTSSCMTNVPPHMNLTIHPKCVTLPSPPLLLMSFTIPKKFQHQPKTTKLHIQSNKIKNKNSKYTQLRKRKEFLKCCLESLQPVH